MSRHSLVDLLAILLPISVRSDAGQERSRQLFDPATAGLALPKLRGTALERAYGHFRLAWVEQWSPMTRA